MGRSIMLGCIKLPTGKLRLYVLLVASHPCWPGCPMSAKIRRRSSCHLSGHLIEWVSKPCANLTGVKQSDAGRRPVNRNIGGASPQWSRRQMRQHHNPSQPFSPRPITKQSGDTRQLPADSQTHWRTLGCWAKFILTAAACVFCEFTLCRNGKNCCCAQWVHTQCMLWVPHSSRELFGKCKIASEGCTALHLQKKSLNIQPELSNGPILHVLNYLY